ncbi:MAG: NAD(P)/FAD-dependent oxidoreductase [Bacteroidota bacterium]
MNALIPDSSFPRVLIIGGGFAGINLAQSLRNKPFQVVLVDKHNYHTFQPLLYQVATGGLEPDAIAYPLRKMFDRHKGLIFRIAEVNTIHPEKKCVTTNIGNIRYDYLVIAAGSQTNFFGNEGLSQLAQGMKSVPEALDLRSLILQNFEEAHQLEEETDIDRIMDFVVVGGGPTGVETAGALAELRKHILPKDYPELDFDMMDIHLIEAGPRILRSMSEKSSEDAFKALEKMGIHVHLETRVTSFDGSTIETNSDLEIKANTVIWAAGIKAVNFEGLEKAVIERGGRYKVDAFNQLEGYEDVFVIGDTAISFEDPHFPDGHPQVAQTAIQMGKVLGKNLTRMQQGAEMRPFRYADKGSMATIGRNKAVLDLGKLHLGGFIAWMGWMFVHILNLIGFRNKAVVFVNWVWNYFTYDKGNRLIIRPFKRKEWGKVEG